MARGQFNELLWFLAVAEERSFTRAAARLGIAQSTLSQAIRQLEGRLGLALLTRTTRSVATTEAGERLRASLGPRIAEIESELELLSALRDRPAGQVRITLSEHAMEDVVWPKLSRVLHRYPDIKVELSIDNRFRNIIEDGFDAGVRLGESIEKDMVAVRISPDWRLVAAAAPAYLQGRTLPRVPQDLLQHACINRRLSTSGGLYGWEFERDGMPVRVKVDGQLTMNSSAPMIAAALDGYGVIFVPESLIADHVASGRLQILLDDWCPAFTGYSLYFPKRRQHLPAFSVIVEALRHR